jgi:hypothetical protein
VTGLVRMESTKDVVLRFAGALPRHSQKNDHADIGGHYHHIRTMIVARILCSDHFYTLLSGCLVHPITLTIKEYGHSSKWQAVRGAIVISIRNYYELDTRPRRPAPKYSITGYGEITSSEHLIIMPWPSDSSTFDLGTLSRSQWLLIRL